MLTVTLEVGLALRAHAVPQCNTLRAQPRRRSLAFVRSDSCFRWHVLWLLGSQWGSPSPHTERCLNPTLPPHTTRSCGRVRPYHPDFCQYLWRETLLLTLSQ